MLSVNVQFLETLHYKIAINIIRETFIFHALFPYDYFPFRCWVNFVGVVLDRFFFHLGDKKKWSLVALDRWSSLYSNDCIYRNLLGWTQHRLS